MFTNIFLSTIIVNSVFGLYIDDECIQNHNNSPGICKKSDECPIVQDLLRCKKIRPTVCGFEESQPVVCCPTNPENIGNCGGTNQLGYAAQRISVQKCNEYKRCGSNSRKKRQIFPTVVGGTQTLPGEFPHMAAIGWRKNDGSGYAWECGGSLISERWVLTAAHCTFNRNYEITKPTIIRLGEHNFRLQGETEIQDLELERIVIHPKYKAPIKYHDIALIQLKGNAIMREHIRPVCLWQTENIPNKKAIAIGWGKIGSAKQPSVYLQKVIIDIFGVQSCKGFYDSRRNLPNGTINEQLCAGDLRGGKDTCQGDSGGPLQIRDPQVFCAFQLIGITSFGVGCGEPNAPAVYTRVSSYLDWIESVVWPN